MNPDQQIRAAALRCAAEYLAGAWAGGFRSSSDEAVKTATKFEAYIREGGK